MCIARVTEPAPAYATLLLMLLERLIEGDKRMGRRRETELPVGLQAAPLLKQVQHNGMTGTSRCFQQISLQHDVGKTGDTLQALV